MLVVDARITPHLSELADLRMSYTATMLEPSKLLAIKTVLSQLRRELPPFPISCCDIAARRIEQLNYGLEYVDGIFSTGTLGVSHAWNFDPDLRLYVDITAWQFDRNLPEILIIPADSPWATDHYQQGYYAVW